MLAIYQTLFQTVQLRPHSQNQQITKAGEDLWDDGVQPETKHGFVNWTMAPRVTLSCSLTPPERWLHQPIPVAHHSFHAEIPLFAPCPVLLSFYKALWEAAHLSWSPVTFLNGLLHTFPLWAPSKKNHKKALLAPFDPHYSETYTSHLPSPIMPNW